nr:uncharacterized protein LOC123751214 [Procambarus clarkii]
MGFSQEPTCDLPAAVGASQEPRCGTPLRVRPNRELRYDSSCTILSLRHFLPGHILPSLVLCFLILSATVVTATFDFVVKPEFGEKTPDLNITTFAGQTGRLPCTVKHLAGKRVSWIRGRDLQVLSTGRVTFSTDLRISVLSGTTKFKTRKSRSLSRAYSRGYVADVPNSTYVDPTGERLAKCHHCTYHSHYPCANFVNKSDFEQETSTKRQISRRDSNPFPNAGQNFQDSQFSIRRRRYKRKERRNRVKLTHIRGNVPERNIYRPETHGSKRRNRRENIFNYWNTEYHHHSKNHKQFTGRKHTKRDQSFDKFPKSGEPQAYAQYNSPIAIYPQGPFTQGMEKKGAQPGPNYIEGVWEPEDYTLQIKYIKPEDSGTYICQINTEPRISQVVHLNVVKMQAEIVGSNELYVKAGTLVTLACRVNHGTLMPGFILWYKGERLVEYDTSGGRIQVVTETDGVSHLLLHDAHLSDSANYTCSPSGGAPASLVLQVIVDERQAAMQQGNSASLPPSSSMALVLPLGVLVSLSAPTHCDADVCTATNSGVALASLLWWARTTASTLSFPRRWIPQALAFSSILLVVAAVVGHFVLSSQEDWRLKSSGSGPGRSWCPLLLPTNVYDVKVKIIMVFVTLSVATVVVVAALSMAVVVLVSINTDLVVLVALSIAMGLLVALSMASGLLVVLNMVACGLRRLPCSNLSLQV